ncbi:MAG: division/cell wall cluster transcriptional repressor MraZ [Bacteroidales bacterium]|nr:division/cell wall cluster transcriptional repressor MraZ [Bacteroidales bacterium]MDY6347677.1 division/cell wall cluster transcriptional repressor MraZ [Bacteroidales bacterium]
MATEYGYWEVSIEKSGRLKLPTALLRSLPEDGRRTFYATHGFGEHIMLWSEKAYREQMDYLNSLDRNITLVKKYRNAFLRNTAVLECDSQQRIVIPKPLMEIYSIDKEVVVLLDNGRIEIWNCSKYHEKFDMSPDDLEKLNEAIHLGDYKTGKEGVDGLS